ncbi:hypothetical protein CEXT_541271 [Caerostris extrusa]|uniref:Uncharacterized protein n=1 Tax=Caerostris extrusa TaxID=172846 RepID=A0AAV4YCZ8_CAEEX|nr:hypothetical protein CEXT_541271 [Caerostris extrusa]
MDLPKLEWTPSSSSFQQEDFLTYGFKAPNFGNSKRKTRNGSVRHPYTSHARHLKTVPFPSVILPSSLLCSQLPKSINVHFGSPDFDTSPPPRFAETEALTDV